MLDGDDLWLPTKLEVQLKAMQASNSAISCTSYNLISHEGVPLGKTRHVGNRAYSYQYVLGNNVIGCLTAMIDTQKTGPLTIPKVRTVAEDFALWLSILTQGHTAQGIPEVLATYRLSRNSRSSAKMRAAAAVWYILRQNEKLPLHKAIFYISIYAFVRSPRIFERSRLFNRHA